MQIDLFSPKKYLWPVNAVLFNLCRLYPYRDNNIWVFGGQEGNKFDDNSRYLFEYVNTHAKDIRSIWLTKGDDTVKTVRSKGYEAYRFDSNAGRKMALRAGVAIYSHGLIDFGLNPLVGGAVIVSLWHGVGFKKIYNSKYHGFKLWLKQSMDSFFSWTYRNITITTSKYINKQFSEIFSLSDSDRIIVAGQPRNDLFKYGLAKKQVLDKYSFDNDKKIIIYMPTYRGKAMGEDAMTIIVQRLYDSSELDLALKRTNSIFLIKLHPLTPHIQIPVRDNFIVLDYGMVESNQELLAVSDVLVTDYSSCCVDFALLNRPVIFYTPDKKEFMEYSEDLFEELLPIFDLNSCCTPKELAMSVEHPSNVAVEKLNEIFEDESIRGTCYSENVYNVICKEVGLC